MKHNINLHIKKNIKQELEEKKEILDIVCTIFFDPYEIQSHKKCNQYNKSCGMLKIN